MKKSTVTIGIPALNEFRNLLRIIPEILSQKLSGFTLKEIVIYSDGSTDETLNLKRTIKSSKVKVLHDPSRLGKMHRINQAFSQSKADIVVILDADITLSSKNILQYLLNPFVKDQSVGYTSGKLSPQKPHSFVQKIAYFGVSVWDIAKKSAHPIYQSEGALRAFSKSLYHLLRFPNASADDIYPYFISKRYNLKFIVCPKAVAFYHLPTIFSDYIKQQLRYHQSENIHLDNFGKSEVTTCLDIKFADKISALIKHFPSDPFFGAIYVSTVVYSRVVSYLLPQNKSSLWEILSSTKNI